MFATLPTYTLPVLHALWVAKLARPHLPNALVLSTPRSAAGQAPLRLGKPLRKKCRASPVLLFKRAGRVVAGSVGIVRATVPFHGEHDALEPTKEG